MNRLRFVATAYCVIPLLVALAGCGGGHVAPMSDIGSYGSMSVTIAWPPSSDRGRVIPDQTESITISVHRNGVEIKKYPPFTRPPSGFATTYQLTRIPVSPKGEADTTLFAQAFSNADGTGTVLASGSSQAFAVREGSNPQQTITMGEGGEAFYRNDFENEAGPEWSNTSINTAVDTRKILGWFNRGTISLSLNDLPAHSKVMVSFDLYIYNSWDGNGPANGPDIWDLSVVGSTTPLLHTTFSNMGHQGKNQAYPDEYPGGDHPAQTGVAEIPVAAGGQLYPIYRLSFSFPHSDRSLALNFTAQLTEGTIYDECWGLDNVEVRVMP